MSRLKKMDWVTVSLCAGYTAVAVVVVVLLLKGGTK